LRVLKLESTWTTAETGICLLCVGEENEIGALLNCKRGEKCRENFLNNEGLLINEETANKKRVLPSLQN
jgi:hypothetical protein